MEEEFKVGFMKCHNYTIESIENHVATIRAPLDENALNPYGFTHGGFVFALGDTAMGVAARTIGKKSVTLSANISYLRIGKGKFLRAEGRIVKEGKNILFTEANVYNEENELIATMSGTYYIMEERR